MKLQIALDDISMEAAMELLGKVKEYADIAEVGTPFLMEYGMEAVRRIHAGFPGLSVLCDGKIMDAGGYEAELAFRAGADYVTVLAVTDDRTILDVAAAANKYGKKTVADMICVENLKERSRQLEELGVDVIAVHTGVDQQAAGRTPLQDLKELRSAVTCAQIAVAGGIRLNTLDAYLEYEPEIIIVGGGIVHAEDPAGETKKLAEKIRERKRMMSIKNLYGKKFLEELKGNASYLEENELQMIVEELLHAGHIFTAGAGRSRLAVQAFTNRLMHLGLPVSHVGEITAPHTKKGDLLLIGSGSGETGSLVEMAKKGKEKWRAGGASYHGPGVVHRADGRRRGRTAGGVSQTSARRNIRDIDPADGLCIEQMCFLSSTGSCWS